MCVPTLMSPLTRNPLTNHTLSIIRQASESVLIGLRMYIGCSLAESTPVSSLATNVTLEERVFRRS